MSHYAAQIDQFESVKIDIISVKSNHNDFFRSINYRFCFYFHENLFKTQLQKRFDKYFKI